jgi:hypothetical protein
MQVVPGVFLDGLRNDMKNFQAKSQQLDRDQNPAHCKEKSERLLLQPACLEQFLQEI